MSASSNLTPPDDSVRRHSETHTAAILEAALDPIVVMDHEGRIRDFNPAAERTFGYSRSEVLGQILADKIIPPSQREAHERGLARFLATGESVLLGRRLEVTAMRADGSEFPAELAISALRDGDRPLFTAYLRDVSERRAMEAELREWNQELERKIRERTEEVVMANLRLLEAQENLQEALRVEQEVGELRSNFVSTVSHEFRTPLGVILSATEMLQRYYQRLTEEERKEQLDTIHEAVLRMAGLMEEVLIFHKLESGMNELTLSRLDVVGLCRILANEVHSATGHRCPIAFEAEALPEGIGEERLLRHTLVNLLNNAVKYSPAGETVLLKAAREQDDAVFQVIDRGIGIPAEDLANLFVPFRRGRNVGQRSGTGLGLVIVRKCVEMHGGAIHFDSAEGKGTTVTVRVRLFAPAADDEKDTAD